MEELDVNGANLDHDGNPGQDLPFLGFPIPRGKERDSRRPSVFSQSPSLRRRKQLL